MWQDVNDHSTKRAVPSAKQCKVHDTCSNTVALAVAAHCYTTDKTNLAANPHRMCPITKLTAMATRHMRDIRQLPYYGLHVRHTRVMRSSGGSSPRSGDDECG
jgi:hypothetical protein